MLNLISCVLYLGNYICFFHVKSLYLRYNFFNPKGETIDKTLRNKIFN